MLRILVISDTYPEKRSRVSILFEKILPILSKDEEIKIFWMSYSDNKNGVTKNFDYVPLHINEFKTAKQVIEKSNPSIIYLIPGMSIIENTFLISAKNMKIPTLQWAVGIPFFAPNKNKKKLFQEMIRQSFEKNEYELNSTRKGIQFIKNHLFFINSMKALGKKYEKIINMLIDEIKVYFYLKPQNKYCNVNLVENQMSAEFLMEQGIPKEVLKVVGDPTYDLAFSTKKINKKENLSKTILFLTVNMTSGQGDSTWTPQNRNKMISQLIKEIKNYEEYKLEIKIHPTKEKLEDYRKIINSDIEIHQDEDIYDLIKKSDIVMTTSSSTALAIALILKKPIIIWNYFNVKEDLFLKHQIALECKNQKGILDCLRNVENFYGKHQDNTRIFIEKFFGSGNALQNIIKEIDKIKKSN